MNVLNNYGLDPPRWSMQQAQKKVRAILDILARAGKIEKSSDGRKVIWDWVPETVIPERVVVRQPRDDYNKEDDYLSEKERQFIRGERG